MNILGESIFPAIDTTPFIKNPLVVDRRRLPSCHGPGIFYPGTINL